MKVLVLQLLAALSALTLTRAWMDLDLPCRLPLKQVRTAVSEMAPPLRAEDRTWRFPLETNVRRDSVCDRLTNTDSYMSNAAATTTTTSLHMLRHSDRVAPYECHERIAWGLPSPAHAPLTDNLLIAAPYLDSERMWRAPKPNQVLPLHMTEQQGENSAAAHEDVNVMFYESTQHLPDFDANYDDELVFHHENPERDDPHTKTILYRNQNHLPDQTWNQKNVLDEANVQAKLYEMEQQKDAFLPPEGWPDRKTTKIDFDDIMALDVDFTSQ
jgi:hypothetical protein